jgi:hypothetical protein
MNMGAGRCLSLAATGLFFLAGCQANKAVSTATGPDGNCIGKICDAAGVPVAGARVLLIPEEYAPSAPGNTSAGIDSAVSDASGRFGFNVGKTGKYNLLANDKSRYALHPSIPINAAARLELPEEKLLDPGSLSGSVRLPSGGGLDSVLVLLPGTNRYAAPDPASGEFSFPKLAQGTYALRILSMAADFSAVETTVTVVSGSATVLPPVILPPKRIPRVNAFSANYDSMMMEAKLSWTSDDTDIITSFNIYCNREKNIIPVTTVGGAVRSVTVDFVVAPLDTFTYQIAAVGKDEWEGPPVKAAPFVNISAVVDSPEPQPAFETGEQYLFNKFGAYAFSTGGGISKRDREFTLVKEITYPARLANGSLPFGSDGGGNIDVLFEADTDFNGAIVKFNKDLDIIGTHPLPFLAGPYDISVAEGSGGSLLVVYSRGSAQWPSRPEDTTIVYVFDREFNLTSQARYGGFREILQSVSFADTTIAIMESNAWSGKRVFHYDAAFSIIKIDSTCNLPDAPMPAGYEKADVLQSCYNDLFFGGCESSANPATILYFFNDKKEIIARCPGPQSLLALQIPGRGFFSDNNGYVYFIDGGIQRYSIDAVIRAMRQ